MPFPHGHGGGADMAATIYRQSHRSLITHDNYRIIVSQARNSGRASQLEQPHIYFSTGFAFYLEFGRIKVSESGITLAISKDIFTLNIEQSLRLL